MPDRTEGMDDLNFDEQDMTTTLSGPQSNVQDQDPLEVEDQDAEDSFEWPGYTQFTTTTFTSSSKPNHTATAATVNAVAGPSRLSYSPPDNTKAVSAEVFDEDDINGGHTKAVPADPFDEDDINDDWLADLDEEILNAPQPKQADAKEELKKPITSSTTDDSGSSASMPPKRASRTQSRLWAERAAHAQTSSRIHRSYIRCKVMALRHDTYEHTLANSSRTVPRPQIIVYAVEKPRRGAQFREDDIGEEDIQDRLVMRKIVLREEWTATRIAEGDYIHCVGNWQDLVIDSQDQHMLAIVDRQARQSEIDRENRWSTDHYRSKKEEKDFKVKTEPQAQDTQRNDNRNDTVTEAVDDMPPSSFESLTDELFANLDEAAMSSTAYAPATIPTMHLLSSSPTSDSVHADNLLILHPDILVTATAVCDVPTCVRKPIVKSRINTSSAADKAHEPLVMGNMLHEVLQACLTGTGLHDTRNTIPVFETEEELLPYLELPFPLKWYGPGRTDFSLAFVVRQVKLQVLNNLDGLLCCGVETMAGEEKLFEQCKPFGLFASKYLQDTAAVRRHTNSDPQSYEDRYSNQSHRQNGHGSGSSHKQSGSGSGSSHKQSGSGSGSSHKQSGSGSGPSHRQNGNGRSGHSSDAAGDKAEPDLLRGLFKGADGMLHMAGVFNEDAVILDSRTTVPTLARVTHVFDVEEEIWSPMYGLKGKMDVSVEVELQETEVERPAWRGGNHYVPGKSHSHSNTNTTTHSGSSFYRRTHSIPDAPGTTRGKGEAKKRYAGIMPLEIKTGRSVDALEHRAQTMLYTLMMSDRYGTDVNSGLLYYTRSGDMHRVKRTRNEVRGLIVGRNELAYWIRTNGKDDDQDDGEEEGGEACRQSKSARVDSNGVIDLATEDEDDSGTTALPPGIDSERECGRCFANNGCMLYRRALDRIVEDEEQPSEVAALYERITSHLTPSQSAFFEQWERLLSLEEQDMIKFKRELWTLTAAAREEVGRCFANMTIDPSQADMGAGTCGGRVHSHTYKFIRKAMHGSPGSALLGGSMSVGDPVVVSIEPATLSVAQGFIVQVDGSSVTVGIDHHLDAVLERAAVEQGHSIDATGGVERWQDLNITFRIDRDEYSDGMAKIRAQLAHLFYSLTDREQRHRELIVDLSPPRFDDEHTISDAELPSSLNEDQKMAMKKVFSAQDYALILGMPGTGKTTTIAEMIKLLVNRGNRILLASYTHSAVDTILRKLIDAENVNMVRMGNVDRIHEDLKPYTLPRASTVEELQSFIESPNVVGTTCLSTNHIIFNLKKFDYCIIDEASQITLPVILGPLKFSNKFILVGDHFQLPPLVRNQKAKKLGLETSLFKRLSEVENGNAVVYLSRQYRMNESIMMLSNYLIYDGLLKCGNENVARQELVLEQEQEAHDNLHSSVECKQTCWLQHLLRPSTHAVFVNTDCIPGRESRRGRMVENLTEGRIVQQVTQGLILGGLAPSDIAVITPYRQQLKLLTSLLPSSGIEILTADRSQGRDKPVVLISLVRSNEFGLRGIGELLQDWRRINVAFTRAQKKIVIIGSQSTLKVAPLLEDFFGLMKRQGWVLDIPHGALDYHQPKDEEDKKMVMRSRVKVEEGDELTSFTVTKKNSQGSGQNSLSSASQQSHRPSRTTNDIVDEKASSSLTKRPSQSPSQSLSQQSSSQMQTTFTIQESDENVSPFASQEQPRTTFTSSASLPKSRALKQVQPSSQEGQNTVRDVEDLVLDTDMPTHARKRQKYHTTTQGGNRRRLAIEEDDF
ncbi:unnamed protein product [Sympodiomycopsis kandeliae]